MQGENAIIALKGFYAEYMMSNIKIADPCNGHEGKFS
jgi:hypothetical protein